MNQKNQKKNKSKSRSSRKQNVFYGAGKTKKMYTNTSNSTSNENKSNIVKIFLEILNMVKLYHWRTHSYAQHKATDDLYSKLNEHIDEFVEVLMGKTESRIKMVVNRIQLIDPNNIREFKDRIYEYRTFLIDLTTIFNDKKDSDLLSIRDELLSDINQFLYLLTLSK
jgi:DNA-binding ferritin-like protein